MKSQRILQLITAVAMVAALAASPATAGAAAPAQTYTRPNVVTLARPFTPTVDGNLSEWGSLPYAINQVVYGSQNWTGAADNSATYAVAWDANKLYLAAYVKDDVFAQTQVNDQIFKGDSLELLFDTYLASDAGSTVLSGDDYELGFSPGGLTTGNNPARQAFRWYPSSQWGVPSGVTVASAKVSDGYQMEVAVPWSVVGASPYAGGRYGFALSTSDNDSSSAVQQTLVSSASTRKLTNPATWGTLILDNVTSHAAHLNTPPAIDGNLSEWGTLANTANQAVYLPGNWTGASDASATYSLGWDANKLYLAAYVKDDVFVQTQSGSLLYLGDSLELIFDTQLGTDSGSTVQSSDDYQLGISPGGLTTGNNPPPQSYRWYPGSLRGVPSGLSIASVKLSDGYAVEAAIPWSALGVTPSGGNTFGFAFSVSDNDAVGTAQQQTLVSSIGTRKLTNPTTWGVLLLDN